MSSRTPTPQSFWRRRKEGGERGGAFKRERGREGQREYPTPHNIEPPPPPPPPSPPTTTTTTNNNNNQ